MFFALSKLLWWLVAPASLLLIVPLVVWLCLLLAKHRLAMALLSGYLLLLAALLFLPLPHWFLLPLEGRFPAVQATALPAQVDGIIVLGGSMSENMTAHYGQPVFNDAAERMTATATLARRYPEARIVLSGGSGLLVGANEVTEADVARDFLQSLGIAQDRVLLEDRSRNTVENVRYSQALVKPEASETWLLVTSAYHMPRSVGIFRQHGWQVIPYPVDYLTAPAGVIDTNYSLLDKLLAINTATREYLGLFVYRLLGYSDSLLPRP